MTAGEEHACLHAVIDGTVQGVGFRAFVVEQARALQLSGWVRNTYDGKVEVTAEGPRPSLEKLLDRLRTGPRMAFVSDIQYQWQAAAGKYHNFDIRRTS